MYLILFLAAMFFFIALAVAPFKLYGIHREAKLTNEILAKLLAKGTV